MSRSIQILFSDAEFEELEKEASKEGLTVPLYIKGQVLKKNDFDQFYKTLIAKVDNLSPGTRYTIQLLFGTDWTMDRGIKLTLGKTYYSRVKNGVITNARATGKDSSNVMWYEKL